MMEANNSMESTERKKTCKGQVSNENEDRISQLPETILHYILSFLPTKQSVRTSLLSTKWKDLWTETHSFNFNDGLVYATKKDILKKKKPFFDFVDRVLLVNDVSNIHRFSLECQECDAAHFDKWVSVAIKRKVQELSLSIKRIQPGIFPHCLFTCDSLRILKIRMGISVNFPASVCFSNLKVLHLESLAFYGHQSTDEISLNFPILEEFVLDCCKWLAIKTVHIFVPKLKGLRVKHWGHEALCDSEIKINAESLTSLNFDGSLVYQYTLCNLSSLVEAKLGLCSFNRSSDDTIFFRLGSLMRAICNVRTLVLSPDGVEVLSSLAFSDHIRSLSHLIRLELFPGGSTSGRKLISLLCNMPNLEYLFFSAGLKSFRFQGQGRILGTTPRCFLSNLKVVKILYFRGINEEMWFVKFIIKSASFMDKLTVKLTRTYKSDSLAGFEKMITEALASLRKDSNFVLELH